MIKSWMVLVGVLSLAGCAVGVEDSEPAEPAVVATSAELSPAPASGQTSNAAGGRQWCTGFTEWECRNLCQSGEWLCRYFTLSGGCAGYDCSCIPAKCGYE